MRTTRVMRRAPVVRTTRVVRRTPVRATRVIERDVYAQSLPTTRVVRRAPARVIYREPAYRWGPSPMMAPGYFD